NKIKELNPDVITLDIEMPGMDGITFLKKLMALRPMPVVMSSSLTQRGADSTIEALEAGAVDYVPKTTSTDFNSEELSNELISKVKNASKVKFRQAKESEIIKKNPILENANQFNFKQNILFAIGSSTGGVEALKDILTNLPKNFPPIVITQHMPPKYTQSFAERLNKICQISVKEAENGDLIEVGKVYIAPGGMHLEVIKRGSQLACVVKYGDKVSGHIPSVDVLFDSVAKNIGKVACGVILTGMGRDGAKGMLEMKKAGCFNFGQDEDSCVVYGMPKAAYLAGAVDEQVSLSKLPNAMINFARVR
ncbi:MAG: chemotaxis response regulator protein-glutamate methylesterase, partial [Rickettsiales bacterium]|nr:chemotaxis response regulator protein-glutamate methylesterase [Rickettsiales bacterium]